MFKAENVKKTDVILFIILIIAGIVRYWGINFGLPHTYCRPDEQITTRILLSYLNFFHPDYFNWPSLYKYIVLCFYTFYFLFGLITGKYGSKLDFVTEYAINPTNFYLIDRFLAAFFGTATVFIVYKIVSLLFNKNKKTALISTLYMSLAYLHVRDSHFGVPDVPMTFFIMCSVLFIVRSYSDKTLKSYVIAGVFAGLATSTKYAGILLTVPMFIVHFFNIFDNKDKKTKLFTDKRIIYFHIALMFSFLSGTPYALLDYSQLTSDFLFEMRHLGGIEVFLGRGWVHHLRFSLFYGLGWSLFLASLAGILILLKTNLRKALILCSFPLVYYILSGKAYTVFLRYIIPLIPFLCITGSIFTIFISDRLPMHFKPYLKNIITFSLVIAIILPSTYNVIQYDRLLAKKDNRLIAREWIYKNIPRGSSIYETGLATKLQLYPTIESLEKKYENYKRYWVKYITDRESVLKRYHGSVKTLTRIIGTLKTTKIKMDYWRKENITGYEQWTYDNKIRKFKYLEKEKNTLPEYIVLEESPLVYSRVQDGIKKILKTSYHLKKSFVVIDIGNKENLFDQQDAFYLPLVGFKDVQRPGPNLYIYEKK